MRNAYVSLLVGALTLTGSAGAMAQARDPFTVPNGNTFSVGYRMGQLAKFSVKGRLADGGEGELLLGNESTPFYQPSGSGSTLSMTQKNPWLFSADNENPALMQSLDGLGGQYVIMKYRQLQFTPPFSRFDTDYRISEVRAVDQNIEPATCVASPAAGGGSFSNGTRFGRIVKLSRKGNVIKSYEAIIQVGNSGANFIEMSVYDDAMAVCMLRWMVSGRRMKLTYNQSWVYNPTQRDTPYEVLRVEAAGEEVRGLTR